MSLVDHNNVMIMIMILIMIVISVMGSKPVHTVWGWDTLGFKNGMKMGGALL